MDKNLKMHGLIQAFSRTNRILNSIKTFGSIVCFRNLQKRVNVAISLFGDKNAGRIVLMQSFKDYYYGYESVDGKQMPGYLDMVEQLTTKFPLLEPQIMGEQNQKDFISPFGAILRMRNLLAAFDEFKEKECLNERDLQDCLGRYQDLRDEWRRKREKGELSVMIEWHDYVVEMREEELTLLIEEEGLKPVETRMFLENAFREGEVKMVGTDIDNIMPPVRRFGGSNRESSESLCRFYRFI